MTMTTARDEALEENPYYDLAKTLILSGSIDTAEKVLINTHLHGLREAREKLARWMIANSIPTGHGDTFDDLLSELAGYVREIRALKEKPNG